MQARWYLLVSKHPKDSVRVNNHNLIPEASLTFDRYTLNYRKLPYEVVWVELPDIEETVKSIGASPTATKPNGQPKYTLPAIHDLNTDVRLSDSIKIVEYLEATYPNDPEKALIPPGTKALQLAFIDAVITLIRPNLVPLAYPQEVTLFDSRSREYFLSTRKEMLGKEVWEIAPPPEMRDTVWKGVEGAWAKVDSWMRKEDRFVMGDTVCFLDFAIAGQFVWYRIMWGEDSEEWKMMSSWQGGRWARLVQDLGEFERLR
ncbi:hypothetical protein VNI00_017379 [Paramarasmius palmivorus]|uniref:GST N-terminal domain-containing protein n=1 Tax=Paramarasmius palmivorus TaxID=297713 RepID=A0AAW0B7R9_9AGAR